MKPCFAFKIKTNVIRSKQELVCILLTDSQLIFRAAVFPSNQNFPRDTSGSKDLTPRPPAQKLWPI